MRLPLLALGGLLALLGAPADAGPKPIPGPLGRDSGHIRAQATLGLTLIPRNTEDPVEVLGNPIPVVLEARATPAKVGDHPFELSVGIFGKTPEGSPDPKQILIRCGTVVADTAHPVPGSAIGVVQQGVGKKKEITETSWTTYTVARTKGVGVGVIDFPLLMEAALLGTSVKGQVPSASFSLGLAKGGKVRFYSETPFQDGTLAMAVEAASWEYVP